MKILIKNARVIDPANNLDDIRDILIEDAKISKVAQDINEPADEVIFAKDKIVLPGVVDMHVHLREPGREDKETIASGTSSALKGGVTTVLAMPNTTPCIDCPRSVKLLKEIINRTAKTDVFICAAITKDRQGDVLNDIAGLRQAGAIAISDDGASVDSDEILLTAFKKAKKENILVICHCEDKTLSRGGSVNLGFTSTRMGLKGISKESEYKRVERDIRLAEKAGASLHIAHISCKESVEIIAAAKKRGVRVTAETAPHYFTFSDEAVLGYDTNLKMNPPLRGKEDLDAIRQGLRTGVIDVIASDHAPHTENEKDIEFERAEFGVIGLETILSVSITELVHSGVLTWLELVKRLSLNPAGILKIRKGTLCVGADADIILLDPQKEWVLNKVDIVSKSKNSPFLGKKLKGRVELTIRAGNIAYKL